MRPRIQRLSLALAALACLTAGVSAQAQDPLARAKTFYAAASYEEALSVLTTLKPTEPTVAVEVSAYEVFCLVALGRAQEARKAIEDIVRTDPMFRPTEAQASPRVRAFFDAVRKPMLPEVLKDTYSRAKTAFEKKDHAAAKSEFDRVIALLDELGPNAGDNADDLRTLATGFRDLSAAALTPPPAAPAEPPAAAETKPAATELKPPATGDGKPPATPAKPTGPVVYTAEDADVEKPTPIARPMPPWTPMDRFEARQDYRGVLELLIAEDGRVLQAHVKKSVQVRYDEPLVAAALGWAYRPAMKDGKPVRYLLLVDVRITK